MTETTTRRALTIRQKYQLMHLISTSYANRGLTDTEFAAMVTQTLGTEIASATIAHYREGLGIKRIDSVPATQLKLRIAELEAQLEANRAAYTAAAKETTR